MLSNWLQENKSVMPLRIEIEVEVETQVKVDYSPTSVVFEDERPSLETYSHDPSRPFSGTAPLSPRADSYQSSSYPKQHNHIMSLPRSDYDPRRVCVNPCPNFTLGKHRRSIGVYLAGALVRVFLSSKNFPVLTSHTIYLYSVCYCKLDIFGCCCTFGTCKAQVGWWSASSYLFRRLGARNFVSARVSSNQLDW